MLVFRISKNNWKGSAARHEALAQLKTCALQALCKIILIMNVKLRKCLDKMGHGSANRTPSL